MFFLNLILLKRTHLFYIILHYVDYLSSSQTQYLKYIFFIYIF